VNGTFTLNSSSLLRLKSCALISASRCVALSGALQIDVTDQALSSASELTLIEYGCATGQFSLVTFMGIPSGVQLQGQVTYEQTRVVARFTGSGTTPDPNVYVPVQPPAPPPSNNGTVNTNCQVGHWTVWDPCDAPNPCGSTARNSTQCTERWVEIQPSGSGAPCPELTKVRFLCITPLYST
jgi:hypothetical protein